ncbi:hypothetical protein TNCV_3984521 [Trichonephila clavipes]|nr:hypothetical protein TNCV_3984521 [Trichonephila clavipes]
MYAISIVLLNRAHGRGSLVVKVTDSGQVCHEFKPSTAQDPPCTGRQSMLNMLRLKHPPFGVVCKLGEGFASSCVVVVTWPWFKTTRFITKSPRVA